MKLDNVFDWSFWDNPQTRTGYPGIVVKKSEDLKLLVGHMYKMKDTIDINIIRKWVEKTGNYTLDCGVDMEIQYGFDAYAQQYYLSIVMKDDDEWIDYGRQYKNGTYHFADYWFVENEDVQFQVEAPIVIFTETLMEYINYADIDLNEMSKLFDVELVWAFEEYPGVELAPKMLDIDTVNVVDQKMQELVDLCGLTMRTDLDSTNYFMEIASRHLTYAIESGTKQASMEVELNRQGQGYAMPMATKNPTTGKLDSYHGGQVIVYKTDNSVQGEYMDILKKISDIHFDSRDYIWREGYGDYFSIEPESWRDDDAGYHFDIKHYYSDCWHDEHGWYVYIHPNTVGNKQLSVILYYNQNVEGLELNININNEKRINFYNRQLTRLEGFSGLDDPLLVSILKKTKEIIDATVYTNGNIFYDYPVKYHQ